MQLNAKIPVMYEQKSSSRRRFLLFSPCFMRCRMHAFAFLRLSWPLRQVRLHKGGDQVLSGNLGAAGATLFWSCCVRRGNKKNKRIRLTSFATTLQWWTYVVVFPTRFMHADDGGGGIDDGGRWKSSWLWT